MYQQVLVELALGREGLDALVATVVLLARVDTDVGGQVAGAGKTLWAIGTAVGALRCVYRYRVFGQLLSSCKRFAAGCAHVILFPYKNYTR